MLDFDLIMKPQRQPGQKAADHPKTSAEIANDLKLIGLAMHNYNDAHRHLPPAALANSNGKPLLSWRVAILPFIEQGNLYQQFHLDEPWDSERNKKLIAQMPHLYEGSDPKLNAAGKTSYVVPVATETMFPPDGKKLTLGDVTDGLSNTIMALQASAAASVVWSKPDDLQVDLKNPLNGLKQANRNSFFALMGDGSVRQFRYKINPVQMRRLLDRADGEVLTLEPDDELPLPRGPGNGGPLDWLPSAEDLQHLESLGFDLNKLRRFLRVGIGAQVGFHLHDAARPLDTDMAAVLAGRGEALGLPFAGPQTFGIGLLVQSLPGRRRSRSP